MIRSKSKPITENHICFGFFIWNTLFYATHIEHNTTRHATVCFFSSNSKDGAVAIVSLFFLVTEKWAKFSTLSQGSSHFERNQFEREKKEWKIDAICYIWYPIVKNLSRSIESVLQYYSCWEGNWARFKHEYHNVFVYQNCTSI